MTLYTIGHSTRPATEFLAILQAFAIARLIDIRTIPRSRKNPQYGQDQMPGWLGGGGIDYSHWPDLGGLRRPAPDSPNGGWRNLSFRGYADYMQTPQFEQALERLQSSAAEHRLAMMCAEAVPWRCHRSLVADALVVRGVDVRHIMSAQSAKPHVLTPWARVDGLRITYPPET